MQQVLKAQSSGNEVTRAMILLDLTGFNMFQGFCRTCKLFRYISIKNGCTLNLYEYARNFLICV